MCIRDSITPNWLTAAGIAAGALNGKGDWNTTTPPTTASIAAAILATPANLLVTDASGRVLLQPTQTGVTIPTVTNVTNGVTLTSGERNSIADVTLGRSVANSESTAAEWSLASLILAAFESSISGTTWTIKRTDGTTLHLTKTVATNAAADPIVGVN